MSVVQIRQRLDAILQYMQPYWEFVNCHMVNYLTENHWDNFIPADLRAEVAGGEHKVRQCIETLFWRDGGSEINEKKFPETFKFINQSENHSLINFKEILTTVEGLKSILHMPCERQSVISIKEFMSDKKRHEVEVTAKLVQDLIYRFQSEKPNSEVFIIDAGDGKGYLSSRLALQYKFKVLGIDSNESNSKNALERGRKLERVWATLNDRAQLESKGIIPQRRGRKTKKTVICTSTSTSDLSASIINDSYKTVSKFITTDLDFVELMREHFPGTASRKTADEDLQFCLTGLHTCGNLAPTCLKLFTTQENFKILCNIGCCYHLLKEEFSTSEPFNNESVAKQQFEIGFPMSAYLRERKVRLGRNARMLAAQSLERTKVGRELPNISLFYRALLEAILCEKDVTLRNTVKVGRIQKFSNFHEYIDIVRSRKAELKLEEIAVDRIGKLEKFYENEKYYLDLFYLLRMTFAPVVESLILLDRLLYLQELKFEQSFLLPLFDAVISPRQFCILALRN